MFLINHNITARDARALNKGKGLDLGFISKVGSTELADGQRDQKIEELRNLLWNTCITVFANR